MAPQRAAGWADAAGELAGQLGLRFIIFRCAAEHGSHDVLACSLIEVPERRPQLPSATIQPPQLTDSISLNAELEKLQVASG